MAKLNEKQKILVVGAAAIVLCAGAGAGVWWASGVADEEREAIAAVAAETQAVEAKIAKIPGVEREVIVLRENVEEYLKILPSEREVSNFVRSAHQFLAQSGASDTAFTPSEVATTKGSPFARYVYTFELQASIWQFMKLLSFFENYERFVRVVSFTLTSADGAQKKDVQLTEGGDKKHKVTLQVETYVFLAASKIADIKIANYANKVASLTPEIIARRNQILPASYEFKGPRGRRDIFVDPRSEGELAADAIPEETQRKLIDDMRRQIADLTGLQRRIVDPKTPIIERYKLQRMLREGLDDTQRKVDEAASKGRIANLVLKVRWSKEVVEPLAQARAASERETASADPYLTVKEMEEVAKDMGDALASGDLDGAKQRFDAVSEKLKVPSDHPGVATARKIQELAVRTRVAVEFSQLKLDIGGVVVNDTGKSGLILNGVVYSEGDYVDSNLLVKSVGSEQVEFVFKGFTVVKVR